MYHRVHYYKLLERFGRYRMWNEKEHHFNYMLLKKVMLNCTKSYSIPDNEPDSFPQMKESYTNSTTSGLSPFFQFPLDRMRSITP